ncbi:MAG: hypothetical protein ACOX2F_03900 [bacterium]
MNRFFFIAVAVFSMLFLLSCGGGKSDKCPEGYTWDGVECKKDDVVNPDKDSNENQDKDQKNDVDQTENDLEQDDNENNDDDQGYTGSCVEVKAGGTLEINVETKVLTIGAVTLNGKNDDENLFGELWGENKATLSEFKIADIDSELSGKKFKIPVGSYDFGFKSSSFENRIVIAENIDFSSDQTINVDLPLFHFSGAVQKNGGVLSVGTGMEDVTKIILRSGSFEKVVPYSDFSSFDITVPKGKYSVYFEGELASGEGLFKGTVLSADNGIEIEDDVNLNINIETVTIKGDAVNKGYNVETGQIVIVETPPFDNISSILIPDLASKSYSATIIKGVRVEVLYLPETDSYPAKYIKLETWDDTSANKTQNIILDFGRIYGSVTFLGNATLPSASKCNGADCTRGKLKLSGFDSSFVVKDFGMSGDDLTYEALVVRRTENIVPDPDNPPSGTITVYNPKVYSMNFESHINNVSGAFEYSPFTVPLKYLNNDGVLASSFTFQNVAEEFVSEKEINFNIAPAVVEGTIALNGSAFTTSKNDFIKIRDLNGIEIPVVNLSELSDETFSFLAPVGEYDIIYEGEGVLGNEFKVSLERDFNISGNLTGKNLSIVTSKIIIDITVNGTSFKEWVKNSETLDGYDIVVNPDKTAANYFINVVKPESDNYYGEVISGLTINAYLNLFFKSSEKKEKSFVRVPLLLSHSMSSDKVADIPVKLTDYSSVVKLNGSPVAGASDHIAQLIIPGQNRTELFYPASGEAKALFKSGEHKSPAPELALNDGFDTKQTIKLECIYFGE